MMIIESAGAVDTGYKGSQQPIIQNLGPGTLYIGTADGNLVQNGLYLPAGAVYEFPAILVEGAGSVWVQADGDFCDVRIINVG